MSEKEKAPSKVVQAAVMFDKFKAEGKLEVKQIYQMIAHELKISVATARGYIWRHQHPEEFKAILKKYFEKRKARLAAEKKAAAKAEEAKKES